MNAIIQRNCVFSRIMLFVMIVLLAGCAIKIEARQDKSSSRQVEADVVNVGPSDIGGVVSSPKGPEAGVWVIAETTDLPTKYRKVVVTDEKGQYLVPDLPNANYKIWVRGYGLVDSVPVTATPGKKVELTAVLAPTVQAAAQVYPANYWLSLLHVPTTGFPKTPQPSHRAIASAPDRLAGGPQSPLEMVYTVKLCVGCHQLGDKATREIEPNLGKFDSTVAAWQRRLMSGQRGNNMLTLISTFPRDRGLTMYADWTDRIAAGEVPPAPPRPQGLERNVVLTEWDWGNGSADWMHDVASTDARTPTMNSNGVVYGASEGEGTIVSIDPRTNKASEMLVPTREDPKTIPPRLFAAGILAPSPYFGDKLVWTVPNGPHSPTFDEKGRIWVTSGIRRDDENPAFCKEGSNNPFAKNYPLGVSTKQLALYDPETTKWKLIDTCFSTQHLAFAKDKDNTLYLSAGDSTAGTVGWLDTKVYDDTGDEQAAQGWCPAYINTRGDGKFNWKTDKVVEGYVYGIAVNPVDGSVWYTATGFPGKIVRVDRGSKPPATCRTEMYEPPFQNPKAPGVTGLSPRGIAIDTKGVIWASLANSGHLASFDRRKCAARNGPTVTGQECPEGWTLYPLPGPLFNGTGEAGNADFVYYDWVDQFDTFGMGKDVPIATGTNSDSLIALDPNTHKWVVLRVPYPMGFYSRGFEGRIDDPKGGWKGRGLWATYSTIPVWHMEGGTSATPLLLHFQIRPDPLAH